MTREKWGMGELLNRAQRTNPDGKVVQLQKLEDIEQDAQEAINDLVLCETEYHQLEQKYQAATERLRTAQRKFIERGKHLYVKGEIVERAKPDSPRTGTGET